MNLVGPLDAEELEKVGFLYVFNIGFPASLLSTIVNRPGVAGAVLQTALSLPKGLRRWISSGSTYLTAFYQD